MNWQVISILNATRVGKLAEIKTISSLHSILVLLLFGGKDVAPIAKVACIKKTYL